MLAVLLSYTAFIHVNFVCFFLRGCSEEFSSAFTVSSSFCFFILVLVFFCEHLNQKQSLFFQSQKHRGWSCFCPPLMWRFNYNANRLSDSTFVICRPLICTNWMYIVWECSYFSNLPLNRQISACPWSLHFIHFRSFKAPQSFLVTVRRSKPPQPFHLRLNWSTSLNEKGTWEQNKMALFASDLRW